ncbi:unnamed protein product [Allacma fusca]|nr:unnamed protein product [Allacma fusca]
MREEDERTRKQRQSYFKAETLSRKTHFSIDEVRSLQVMYAELIAMGKMDRLRFREVMYSTFDITDDVMLDRIFRVFDGNNDTLVDETEWVQGLSTLLRGTLEEYIGFCYFIYDINGDRLLGRDELFFCLKNCLIRSAGIEEDVEESIKDIVEIAMKKLDADKNGKISFSDFETAVKDDPLLLEACGPCLPPAKAVNDFLTTFTTTYKPPKISLRMILPKRTGLHTSRPGNQLHAGSAFHGSNSQRSSPVRKSPDRKSPGKH